MVMPAGEGSTCCQESSVLASMPGQQTAQSARVWRSHLCQAHARLILTAQEQMCMFAIAEPFYTAQRSRGEESSSFSPRCVESTKINSVAILKDMCTHLLPFRLGPKIRAVRITHPKMNLQANAQLYDECQPEGMRIPSSDLFSHACRNRSDSLGLCSAPHSRSYCPRKRPGTRGC